MNTVLKPESFILPAAALILVGGWITSQRRSMAVVETDCARLRTFIAATPSPSRALQDPLEKQRKIIQWTKLAEHFPSNPTMSSMGLCGALPDPRVAMRFRQRMEAMTPAEIIATLDEVAALDLPAGIRANLMWTLLDALARKDPGMALDQIDRRVGMEDYRFGSLFSGALQTWARKDPDAAGAWFDQQIAEGKFKGRLLDGVNATRQANESALISILLANSPAAAARRLAALPEDQRGDVLSMYDFSSVPQENQVAYAGLIRAEVPAKDQADAIASQMTNLIKRGDYSAATAYLDRIAATPAERAASARKAIQDMFPISPDTGKLSRQDFDALREWVGSQAPAELDKVTVEALAKAAQGDYKMQFAAAAGLAVEYSAESGNDEVLAGFLTSEAARRNKAASRVLAEKISDETRRAEILTFLK